MNIRRSLPALLMGVFATLWAFGDGVCFAGKTPPLPFPVKYRIKLLQHPDGSDCQFYFMNFQGIAIGSSQCNGCVFNAETGEACWNLSELIAPEYQQLIPTGATFSVGSISDSGKLTGTMCVSGGSVCWAYVIDTHNSLVPAASSFRLIDATALPSISSSRGLGINDSGDLLGLYCDATTGEWHLFVGNLNDLSTCHRFDDLDVVSGDWRTCPRLNRCGEVAGQLTTGEGFRYTPGDVPTIETFPTNYSGYKTGNVNGFNDNGVVCGAMATQSSVSGCFWHPYRCYDTPNADIPIPIETIANFWAFPVRVNTSCDLMVDGGVYHETSQYLFRVESLVDPGDLSPADRAIWDSRVLGNGTPAGLGLHDMTDRYPTATDKTVGRLCGILGYTTGKGKTQTSHSVGIVLTPQY